VSLPFQDVSHSKLVSSEEETCVPHRGHSVGYGSIDPQVSLLWDAAVRKVCLIRRLGRGSLLFYVKIILCKENLGLCDLPWSSQKALGRQFSSLEFSSVSWKEIEIFSFVSVLWWNSRPPVC
jgi:hypothetical protein